jgi:hypothetical protein
MDQPMMPGDGRFPEDPEFQLDPIQEGAGTLARAQVEHFNVLVAGGMTREEALFLTSAMVQASASV